jgi:hypothetical protein
MGNHEKLVACRLSSTADFKLVEIKIKKVPLVTGTFKYLRKQQNDADQIQAIIFCLPSLS